MSQASLPRESKHALINLASRRRDMPPRVHNLLEGVLGLCTGMLERPLAAALTDFEQQLFKLADRTRHTDASQQYFETLREVKRGRSDVAPRFMLAVEDNLATFDGHVTTERVRAPRELSLVDTSDLDESLALQEIAVKSEIRHAHSLYALGHRFGVLAAMPAFDTDRLPVGPSRISSSVGYAAACLNIALEHRTLLYQAFDRLAMTEIGAFYEALNNYFVEHRILRHFRAHLVRNRSAPPGKTDAPARPIPAATTADSATGALGLGAVAPVSFSAAASALRALVSPIEQHPPSAAIEPARPAHGEDSDLELFATLRELIGGKRHVFGGDSSPSNAFVPNADDIQSVLGALQSRPVAPMILGGKVVQRSVAQLKHDLLGQLRQLAPLGQTPHLAGEDADTIELVSLLFDHIGHSLRPNGTTNSLLTKLQVPLLRVALRDKGFFTRRTHPARQLLNTLAETGMQWMEDADGSADSALIEKMNLIAERVTSEFDGDVGLLEELLNNLTQHMHTLLRKADAAERRLVTAAKGREKLALARETAGAAIFERVMSARPGPLVRTLLEQAWTDVLALTLLRHGEQSEMYRKQLAVADALITMSTQQRSGNTKPMPAALRDDIESGLSQVGYHSDDVQAVVQRLFVPDAIANLDNAPTQTDLAMKLRNRARLGEDAADDKPLQMAAARRATLQLNDEEQQMVERLRNIPFGTWFEFVHNQQGERVRRKLSWFSPVTGRCLFVNQRGARADERSIEQLARDVVHGDAKVYEPEPESLVDRAWRAIVSSLRQLTGRGTQPTPA